MKALVRQICEAQKTYNAQVQGARTALADIRRYAEPEVLATFSQQHADRLRRWRQDKTELEFRVAGDLCTLLNEGAGAWQPQWRVIPEQGVRHPRPVLVCALIPAVPGFTGTERGRETFDGTGTRTISRVMAQIPVRGFKVRGCSMGLWVDRKFWGYLGGLHSGVTRLSAYPSLPQAAQQLVDMMGWEQNGQPVKNWSGWTAIRHVIRVGHGCFGDETMPKPAPTEADFERAAVVRARAARFGLNLPEPAALLSDGQAWVGSDGYVYGPAQKGLFALYKFNGLWYVDPKLSQSVDGATGTGLGLQDLGKADLLEFDPDGQNQEQLTQGIDDRVTDNDYEVRA